MPALSLSLLGPFSAHLDKQPLVNFRSNRVQALLIYLAVEQATAGVHTHRRDSLMAMLWPEMPQRSAQTNLRQTLYLLRKRIPQVASESGDKNVPFLLSDRRSAQINPACTYAMDVADFDRLTGRSQPVAALEEAVGLYRGDFLADFYLPDSSPFEEWAGAQRESLRLILLNKLEQLADHFTETAGYKKAEAYARRQLDLDPLIENAHRQLMLALAKDGRRSAALSQYQTCRKILIEELGVEPAEETRALYERLARGEEAPAAPLEMAVKAVGTRQDRSDDFPQAVPIFLEKAEKQITIDQGAFVGREQQLSQLEGYLEQALRRRGQVAFVVGEAGRGKTTLINQFARLAQDAHPDLIVASGVCSALTGIGDPYLPFRDILGMLTGDVETRWEAGAITRDHALRLWRFMPHTVQVLVDRGADLIETFVPGRGLVRRAMGAKSLGESWRYRLEELVAHKATLSGVRRAEQNRIFEAFTEVLRTLSTEQPLMLILDDLQWADGSSIGLLFHLGRRLTDRRILIVGSYRSEDIARGRDGERHPLEEVISELKRQFSDVRVDLDREGETEGRRFVDTLLDSEPNQLGEDFRQELTSHTGGHALFTVELLRDMQERGELLHDDLGRWVTKGDLAWDALPARVEGVIERRVGRLATKLQEVLTVASVEGETFTAEVVARALSIEERELIRHLSRELDKRHRLVRARGFERLGSQRLSHYRFRHNLFQRFLYNGLDEVERAYLHEAVGNELEKAYLEQGEELAVIADRLAHHFLEAGDNERALTYYTQAGDRAVRLYAYEEARQFLQRAIRLSETDDGLLERQIELLEKLGDVNSLLGDHPEAIPRYRRALDIRKNLVDRDKWTTIRLHRKIGESWNSISHLADFLRLEAEARASLEAGLKLTEGEAPHPETVRLLVAFSKKLQWEGPYEMTADLETAERYARAAVEMAEELSDTTVLSAALARVLDFSGAHGRWRERLQIAKRRLGLSQESQFGDLRENLDILIGIGQASMGLGQYTAAIPYLQEAEALGGRVQDVQGQAWALANEAFCWLHLDRWDEVIKAEKKLKNLQQHQPPERLGVICWLLSTSAVVHGLRGEFEQAAQLRDESYQIMTVGAGLEEGTEEHWIMEHHY